MRDGALSREETDYLKTLRAVLALTTSDLQQAREKAVAQHYSGVLDAAVADGTVSPEELHGLQLLQEALDIPPELHQQLYKQSAVKLMQAVLNKAVEDRRLSPEEDTFLLLLSEHLGVEVRRSASTASQLEKFSLLWYIENIGAPTLDECPIALQKNEFWHFSAPVQWYELRTRTVRINYHGPVASIRIARGLRYRFGSITPQRITRDELTLVDTGTVYLTNKRVIFNGEKKNTSIRYSAMIGIEVFSDALKLEKANGRSPLLVTSNPDALEIMACLVSTLLREPT